MNNLFIFVLAFLILIMFSERIKTKTDQLSIGDYKTIHFQKDSKKFFEEVELETNYSEETLQELAMMEDQFLSYERQTVCDGVSRLREASTLDQQMKDRFSALDFMHHQIHIKQMAEPSKLVNKNLKCS